MNTSFSTNPFQLIIIPTSNGMMRMRSASEIKYICGSGPVSDVYLQSGQVLKSTRGLIHYQRQLDVAEGFYRFSQSLLVNMQFVDAVLTRKQELVLRCGTGLSISRRCCQQFKKWCRSFDQYDAIADSESEDDEPNNLNNNKKHADSATINLK